MAGEDMARKIKELRKEKGLTLEQVATIVGVGKSTVRKWETGMIANMRRDKIAALARALGTTPIYLMGWEEEQKKNDIQADIILRMRSDDDFMSAVESLYNLDKEQLQSITAMLHTLVIQTPMAVTMIILRTNITIITAIRHTNTPTETAHTKQTKAIRPTYCLRCLFLRLVL